MILESYLEFQQIYQILDALSLYDTRLIANLRLCIKHNTTPMRRTRMQSEFK